MNTMTLERTEETFESLEKLGRNGHDEPELTADEQALPGRNGDIAYMVQRDGIWPPAVSNERTRFSAALREALCRLPQKAFDKVDEGVRFLLDDPSLNMFAVNAPAPPPAKHSNRPGIDTIVFFRSCVNLPPKALTGLIAYEIAHSFVCGKDFSQDGVFAETKAREWGFGAELDCLLAEKQRMLSVAGGEFSP